MKKKDSIIIGSFLDFPVRQLCTVPIIVIYKSPADYPGQYVARLWDVRNRPTRYAMIKDSLEDVRKGIPVTMIRLSPSEKDDPVIIETWL
jgi:hypothetical protein